MVYASNNNILRAPASRKEASEENALPLKFNELPNEVISLIFTFTDPYTLCKLSETNKQFNHIIADDRTLSAERMFCRLITKMSAQEIPDEKDSERRFANMALLQVHQNVTNAIYMLDFLQGESKETVMDEIIDALVPLDINHAIDMAKKKEMRLRASVYDKLLGYITRINSKQAFVLAKNINPVKPHVISHTSRYAPIIAELAKRDDEKTFKQLEACLNDPMLRNQHGRVAELEYLMSGRSFLIEHALVNPKRAFTIFQRLMTVPVLGVLGYAGFLAQVAVNHPKKVQEFRQLEPLDANTARSFELRKLIVNLASHDLGEALKLMAIQPPEQHAKTKLRIVEKLAQTDYKRALTFIEEHCQFTHADLEIAIFIMITAVVLNEKDDSEIEWKLASLLAAFPQPEIQRDYVGFIASCSLSKKPAIEVFASNMQDILAPVHPSNEPNIPDAVNSIDFWKVKLIPACRSKLIEKAVHSLDLESIVRMVYEAPCQSEDEQQEKFNIIKALVSKFYENKEQR